MISKWLYFYLISILIGCSTLVPDPYRNTQKSSDYTISNPVPDGWQQVNSDIGDFVYVMPSTGRHFIVHSQCQKFLQDDLKKLTSGILQGIENLKIHSQEKIVFYNREAVIQHGQGKLDGAQFNFFLLTYNRNFCTYDFTYLIPGNSEQLKSDRAEFGAFLDKVIFK